MKGKRGRGRDTSFEHRDVHRGCWVFFNFARFWQRMKCKDEWKEIFATIFEKI